MLGDVTKSREQAFLCVLISFWLFNRAKVKTAFPNLKLPGIRHFSFWLDMKYLINYFSFSTRLWEWRYKWKSNVQKQYEINKNPCFHVWNEKSVQSSGNWSRCIFCIITFWANSVMLKIYFLYIEENILVLDLNWQKAKPILTPCLICCV